MIFFNFYEIQGKTSKNPKFFLCSLICTHKMTSDSVNIHFFLESGQFWGQNSKRLIPKMFIWRKECLLLYANNKGINENRRKWMKMLPSFDAVTSMKPFDISVDGTFMIFLLSQTLIQLFRRTKIVILNLFCFAIFSEASMK